MPHLRRSDRAETAQRTVVDWSELTLTHRCNQRCFFCYEEGRDIAQEPSREEVRKLLEETSRRAKLVVLCGKEVLLRPDALDIVADAASLGLDVAVFTNGQALSRERLVEELVEAGCGSLVFSFHFPDAEAFARGTRTRPEGFERVLSGMRNVASHLRANPGGGLGVSTETDMCVLNAGRLGEMRATLIQALGDVPWQMRLGSLLPTQTHDIGIDHILEPMEERRQELADFISTHPQDLPLAFVKTPLCLLPPSEVHRSLDVQYIYAGTVLTFNHVVANEVTLDTFSTSAKRNVARALRHHPYRWVCRACPLLPLCRYERVSWDEPRFEPRREHKPTPLLELTPAEVLGRLGPDRAGARRVEAVARGQRDLTFPEETLLQALREASFAQPELVDAYVDGPPVLVVEFSRGGYRVPLHIAGPRQPKATVILGTIIDYLHVESRAGRDVPVTAVHECLRHLSRQRMPELESWLEAPWFDVDVARLLRAVWTRLGERVWPGGSFGPWRVEASRLTTDRALLVGLVHATGARARLTHALPARTEVLFREHAPRADEARSDVADLLVELGTLLSGERPSVSSTPEQCLGREPAEAHLHQGQWRWRSAPIGAGEIVILVRDRNADDREYRFHVAPHRAGQPYFRRVGPLVLWYSHGHMTPRAEAFSRWIEAAMRSLRSRPVESAMQTTWRDTLQQFMHRSAEADRFEWVVSWREAS